MPKKGAEGIKYVRRLCYWCSEQLTENSHGTCKDPLGNEVKVHNGCVKSMEKWVKSCRLTARPPDNCLIDGC